MRAFFAVPLTLEEFIHAITSLPKANGPYIQYDEEVVTKSDRGSTQCTKCAVLRDSHTRVVEMEMVSAVTKNTGQNTGTSRSATARVARGVPKGIDEDYRGMHDQGVASPPMNPNMAQYIIGVRHLRHSNTSTQSKKRGSYASPSIALLRTCQELSTP